MKYMKAKSPSVGPHLSPSPPRLPPPLSTEAQKSNLHKRNSSFFTLGTSPRFFCGFWRLLRREKEKKKNKKKKKKKKKMKRKKKCKRPKHGVRTKQGWRGGESRASTPWRSSECAGMQKPSGASRNVYALCGEFVPHPHSLGFF